MLVHAVWALGDGRLLVCDRENNRVQVFSADGKYLQEWTDLARPDDLWVDADGLVYVAELGERSALFPHMTPPYGHDRPGRVSVLNLDGDLVRRWGGDDPYATGSFFAPHGIAVDSRGNVYVSEVLAATYGGKGIVDFDRKHALTKFARV
jgi:sugar lactone lactonase YvrE